jgi:hypothetical protein
MPGALGALLVTLLGAAPASTPAPRVTCDAEQILLTDAPAPLHCTVKTVAGGGPLRASSNVGTLEAKGPAKGRERRFVFQAAEGRVPRVALLAFWHESPGAQPPEVALVRVPLVGRQTVSINTRPGASVEVMLGARQFGPVLASSDGKVQVDIEVPPDATVASVVARSARQEKQDRLPIEVPPSNPLLTILSPGKLARGESAWLWVLHQDTLPGRQLEFTHRGLTFRRVRFLRDRGLFQVTAEPEAREARIEVRLADVPEAQVILEDLLKPVVEPTPERPTKAVKPKGSAARK